MMRGPQLLVFDPRRQIASACSSRFVELLAIANFTNWICTDGAQVFGGALVAVSSVELLCCSEDVWSERKSVLQQRQAGSKQR